MIEYFDISWVFFFSILSVSIAKFYCFWLSSKLTSPAVYYRLFRFQLTRFFFSHNVIIILIFCFVSLSFLSSFFNGILILTHWLNIYEFICAMFFIFKCTLLILFNPIDHYYYYYYQRWIELICCISLIF